MQGEMPGCESDGDGGMAIDHAVAAALMSLGEPDPLRAAIDDIVQRFGATSTVWS